MAYKIAANMLKEAAQSDGRRKDKISSCINIFLKCCHLYNEESKEITENEQKSSQQIKRDNHEFLSAKDCVLTWLRYNTDWTDGTKMKHNIEVRTAS